MQRQKLLVLVLTSLKVAGAATLTVAAGGNLQSILNSAQPGDVVQIAAGATFTGHFYLPSNPGPQAITIQSSAMASLPPSGNRISPNQAAYMPKLVTPDSAPALQMTTGANNYLIQGLEFLPAAGVYIQDLIQVGNAGETATSLVPRNIDFDRNYIHGDPSAGGKRGIALNGANITVENSYIAAFTSTWQDTQAIAGWNGPGPFQILNNHLEAGTEIVAFGGAVPAIPGVLPSDILIRNNQFYKPLSWQVGSATYAGVPIWAKNHIELKFAQRVTIDSNTFDNNWVGADQRGFVMVFNVRAEQGAVPWAVVNGVTVTNNVIRHAAAGAVFVGHDPASGEAGTLGQFLVQNNVWEDITGSWGGDGRLFQVQDGVSGLTFDHNTAFQGGYALVFGPAASTSVNFTNNITNVGWGVAGDNQGAGIPSLNTYDMGGVFSNNVLIGGSPSGYPANNFFPSSIAAVGFVNYAAENFLLSSTSPYLNSATNGGALGSSVVINSTSSIPNPVPTGWVEIVNNKSGSCVDLYALAGSQYLVGTQIQQYTCWGGFNQQFQFTPVRGGYEITNRASGLQLDVLFQNTTDGTPIIQYPFWGGANEIWSLVDAGNGYYSIHPNNSGKCMDVFGESTANGTQIEQWSCSGKTNEQFRLVPIQ